MQPREALLKYADLADKDPQWTAGESYFAERLSSVAFVTAAGARAETIFLFVDVDWLTLTWPKPCCAAWKVNQPTPVFSTEGGEEETEDK